MKDKPGYCISDLLTHLQTRLEATIKHKKMCKTRVHNLETLEQELVATLKIIREYF